MKFHRVQPYRDVFIAELRAQDVRSDGKALVYLPGGVGVFTAFYVVDDMGDSMHPIQAFFKSPVWACAAADILIDNPKMFEAKVSSLLRHEEKSLKEW
jgi:hypothetical protein